MKVKTSKGFTLAELLIVMAIIVVLAAVAIPTFGRQLETARETGDMELIRGAYTEALSLAIIDGADGVLDGKKGTTDLASSSETEFKITDLSTPADNKKIYVMKLTDTIKQANSSWQYVNNTINGVTVDAAAVGSGAVKFTFELDTAGTGAVRLVNDTSTKITLVGDINS